MRQVKMSDPHAGERIEHLVGGGEILHSLSPGKVGLLQADHERSGATIAARYDRCKRRMRTLIRVCAYQLKSSIEGNPRSAKTRSSPSIDRKSVVQGKSVHVG